MHFTSLLCSLLTVGAFQTTNGFTAAAEARASSLRTFNPEYTPSSPSQLFAETLSEAEVDLLPSIREAIEESGEEAATSAWIEAVEIVSSKTGLAEDSAEMALAKANGWRAWVKVTSKFAKKYMKTYIPEKEKLEAAMDWALSGPLNFSEDQLAKAIVGTPEVYLMEPKTKFEKARSVAPKDFQDSEKFAELAVEDPSILALTFNCVDSGCSSECGNCWVSYENRK